MELSRLKRVRWAVRMTLILGVAASVVANILHARENPISQAIAAWPPLALLLTVELISRVPVHRRSLAAARLVATATIAGIAAWVSYWHMVGVAARYGEEGAAPYLLPLSVDGLIVVASICLVELGSRITAALSPAEGARSATTTDGASTAAAAHAVDYPQPVRAAFVNGPIVRTEAGLHSTRTPSANGSRTSGATDPDTAPAVPAPTPDAVRTPVPDTAPAVAAPEPDTARTPDPDTRRGTAHPVPDTARAPEAPVPDTARSSGTAVPDTAREVDTPEPDAGERVPVPARGAVSEPAADGRIGGSRPVSGRPDIQRTPAAQGVAEPPRPRTSSAPAAVGHSGGVRTSGALAHALEPAAVPAGSTREQVFLLLDQKWSVEQVRQLRPTKVADELLPRLDSADRDTVARYVRAWCDAIDSGRRVPAGQLRSVPRR